MDPANFKLLILGGIVLAFGVSIIKYARRSMAAQHWIEADARVVETRIDRGHRRGGSSGRHFVPRVVYEFKVGGILFRGDEIRKFGLRGTSSRSWAEQQLAHYAVGDSITIHHDPRDPNRSSIEIPTSAAGGTAAMMLAGVAGLAGTGLILAAFGAIG
jgi:hypothetical protein